VWVDLEAKFDFCFLAKTRIDLDATLWNECNEHNNNDDDV
jgi:hypothetical protein